VTAATIEFLIRRSDPEGSWFDLAFGDMASVLRPTSISSEVIDGTGELRLRIADIEVEINLGAVPKLLTENKAISIA